MKKNLLYRKSHKIDSIYKINVKKKQEEINYSFATLLIPLNLHSFFKKRTHKLKPSQYLKLLLNKYRYILLNFEEEFAQRLNTKYQDKKLELQKETIKVEYESWSELKCLKIATNHSICAIFSFLVYLDYLNIVENCPIENLSIIVPKNPKFVYRIKIFFSPKVPLFRREFYYRRFDYQ